MYYHYKPETVEEGRFPFSGDREAMRAFMHRRAAEPGDTTLVTTAGGDGLAIAMEKPMPGSKVQLIARYDTDGGIELVFPSNPLIEGYAQRAWNMMLDWLAEPNDRRVEHTWEDVRAPGQKLSWPASHWLLDNRRLAAGDRHVLCGRLTLAAWRVQNP